MRPWNSRRTWWLGIFGAVPQILVLVLGIIYMINYHATRAPEVAVILTLTLIGVAVATIVFVAQREWVPLLIADAACVVLSLLTYPVLWINDPSQSLAAWEILTPLAVGVPAAIGFVAVRRNQQLHATAGIDSMRSKILSGAGNEERQNGET